MAKAVVFLAAPAPEPDQSVRVPALAVRGDTTRMVD
jgi:hypothetical protein